jgi:RNA methyltransferase, TrmH family
VIGGPYDRSVTDYEITSAANPRMRRLTRLGERRHRDAEGVFVVEGERLVRRALDAGLEPLEAFGDGTVEVEGLVLTLVAPGVLDRVSYRQRSEGLIAVFGQHDLELDDIRLTGPALLLVGEDLEKPGNLGAIQRTAEAVGADGVVTVPPGVDRYNPNALRASTGACFTMPTVAVTLDRLVDWLHRHGISLVAADPAGGTTLWEADLTGPVALMVGAEDAGLSEEALEAADLRVTIPMLGAVDSLNASVAMAVLAYEALRQRSFVPRSEAKGEGSGDGAE